jgi:hypothetical protein
VPPEQVEATNGTATVSPADLRAQILAGIPDEAAPVKAAAADEESAAEVEPEVEASNDEEDDAAPEEAEDSDEDTDVDAEPDEDAVVAADPKAAKGLDAVRKAEKRHREKMDADRAEFAAEKQKHAAAIEKVAEFEAAAKRVKYDPAPVLKLLGVTEDDFELLAHAIYAESKAGAADPKRKEAAAQRLRDREKDDKLTATEKRMADLEAKLERQAQETTQREQTAQYVQQVTGAAKSKFPLVAKLLELDPQDASDGLAAAYDRLVKASGKEPTPAAVVAELDRKERTRLKKLGIDPDTIAKAAPKAAKPGAKPAAKPAATNGKSAAMSEKERILAELSDTAPLH